MRMLLMISIFCIMSGAVNSDDNIYGPNGENLGVDGNPFELKSQPATGSRKTQTKPFDSGVRNDNRNQSLEWNEEQWSNSGNVEQDRAINARINDRNWKRFKKGVDEQYGISAKSIPEQYPERLQEITINIQPNNHRSAGNSGAVNSITGEYYPSSGPGYVNPEDGRFYAPSGPNGVVDTQTGEFIPITGGANPGRRRGNTTQKRYSDPNSRLNGNRWVPWH
jgi:hypothetical protein